MHERARSLAIGFLLVAFAATTVGCGPGGFSLGRTKGAWDVIISTSNVVPGCGPTMRIDTDAEVIETGGFTLSIRIEETASCEDFDWMLRGSLSGTTAFMNDVHDVAFCGFLEEFGIALFDINGLILNFNESMTSFDGTGNFTTRNGMTCDGVILISGQKVR